jgi:hypothetical protein
MLLASSSARPKDFVGGATFALSRLILLLKHSNGLGLVREAAAKYHEPTDSAKAL